MARVRVFIHFYNSGAKAKQLLSYPSKKCFETWNFVYANPIGNIHNVWDRRLMTKYKLREIFGWKLSSCLVYRSLFKNAFQIVLSFSYVRYYSLSDSSLATAFPTFLWQNVRVFHTNSANILGALLRVCINILFVSTPQNVDFAH